MVDTFEITILTNPLPKGRPRLGKGKVYTPVETAAYETEIGYRVGAAIDAPLEGPLFVRLRFYRGDNRRADLDNLIKAVLDGMNAIAYTDDAQIVKIEAEVHRGCDPAYVYIYLAELGDHNAG